MNKEKQIEEMANAMCNLGEASCQECSNHWEFVTVPKCDLVKRAEKLYNAGYRKQSEGEWIENEDDFYIRCSACEAELLSLEEEKTPYCPNCGAKMKGGE